MSGIAYVDSSCLVAVALREASAGRVAERIRQFNSISAHPLLDAEVRSACAREEAQLPDAELEMIDWVEVPRPLSAELDRVLRAGYVHGADCLHLATALYMSPEPAQLTFLTLDLRQRAVAKKLGFKV